MKRLTVFAILSFALTACPRIPPAEPYLSCFQIYIKDNAGIDLIKKNLAEFVPDIKAAPWFVLLPPDLYDARISVNGKNIEKITLRMYYPTDDKHPFHLIYEQDLQQYYERAGKPETGTVIYSLTFPLLFGDDKTLQIKADWRVFPAEDKNGNVLWFDKITVNGELMPIPDSSALFLTI